jgi:DNA-binding TFAR19-related protein (PDSD5 family)
MPRSQEEALQQQQQAQQQEEQRQVMLQQILAPDARERSTPSPPLSCAHGPGFVAAALSNVGRQLAVSRISLVKPEKARQVENMLLGMAQKGQIRQK